MAKTNLPPASIPIFSYERKDGERNTRQTEQALAQLGPLSGNLRIQELELAAGNNTIYHGAGRIPSNRLITYQSASATFYDGEVTSTTWVLNSSGAATIRILFW